MSSFVGPQTRIGLDTHGYSGRSLCAYPDLVRALLAVKLACAETNARLGYIKKKDALALVRAIKALQQSADWDEVFVADVWQGGGAIAINANMNEAIGLQAQDISTYASLANLHQSTADVVATAARMAIFERVVALLSACEHSLATIAELSKLLGQQRRQAYTCLQPAMQTTVKQFLQGFGGSLRHAQKSLAETSKDLTDVPLGGTVIGDGAGAPQDYQAQVIAALARLVDQPLRKQRCRPAVMQSGFDLMRVMDAIAQMARVYLKMAKDLRLEQSPLGSMYLPGLIAGSSFFKGKINPTLAETLVGCCLRVIAMQGQVAAAAEQAELDLNVFEMFMVIPMLDSTDLLEKCLIKFNEYGLAKLQIKGRDTHE